MQRLSAHLTYPFVLAATLAACSSNSPASTPSDVQYRDQITTGMQASMLTDIDALLQAAKDLQAAAPVITGRGWDKTLDKDAIDRMKNAWIRARTGYEHTEGALAPIFPDTDASIDERYDGFLADLESQGKEPDTYLFDNQGVTGLHAVERILYSDVTPPSVIAYEATINGYVPAAFPNTEQEAADFKNKLVARMIVDAQHFHDGWKVPANIALPDAFKGLTGLMNEQSEKVNNAANNQEESRYAQRTMADLRDNLVGTKSAYELFRPWLVTKPSVGGGKNGMQTDQGIQAGFAALAALYAQVPGAGIPERPATWNPDSPSQADLATPFGKLYTGVRDAVDPSKSGSVVEEMNNAATLLGLPVFTVE